MSPDDPPKASSRSPAPGEPSPSPSPGSLPVVAEARLDDPPQMFRVVTFLNRSLKAYGLVFGLRRDAEGEVLTIYRVP
jgi:hypothetical protein